MAGFSHLFSNDKCSAWGIYGFSAQRPRVAPGAPLPLFCDIVQPDFLSYFESGPFGEQRLGLSGFLIFYHSHPPQQAVGRPGARLFCVDGADIFTGADFTATMIAVVPAGDEGKTL